MKIKQLDTFLLRLLVFVAPWTIMALSQDLLFPYVTSKVFIFRSLVELAFSLWLVRFVFDQNYRLCVLHPLVFVMTAFVAWVLVANNLGVSPYRSFWSNYERMDGGLTLLHYFVFFLVLATTLNTPKRRFVYVLNLLIVISVVGYLGLHESGRASSVLGNPIYLGNLAVTGFFLSGFWVFSFSGARQYALIATEYWLLLAVFFVAVLVASATRGAALGLLAGMLVTVLALVVSSQLKYRVKGLIVVSSGLLLVYVYGLLAQNAVSIKSKEWFINHPLFSRISEISLNDQTTADRIENWRIAIAAGNQHPVLGWGQEAYSSAFLEFYQPLVMDQAAVWFDRAHNVYLDWLVAAGYPGVALFLLIWLVSVIGVWRVKEWSRFQKSFLTGLIAAYLARNGVGFDSFSDWVLILSVLALIVSAGMVRQSRFDQNHPKPWFFVTSLGVAAIMIYQFNLKPWYANRDILLASRMFSYAADPNYLLQCRHPHLIGDAVGRRYCTVLDGFGRSSGHRFQPISALLSRAKSVYAPSEAEAFELFAGRVTQSTLAYSAPSDEALVAVLLSMAMNQLHFTPRDWRLQFNMAVLYSDIGQDALALNRLKLVSSAAPSKTIFWLTLAKVYVRMSQFEQAKDAYNLAYGLNPQHAKISEVYEQVNKGYGGDYIFKPSREVDVEN